MRYQLKFQLNILQDQFSHQIFITSKLNQTLVFYKLDIKASWIVSKYSTILTNRTSWKMNLNSSKIIIICLSMMAVLGTDPRKMQSKFQFVFWLINVLSLLIVLLRGCVTLIFNDGLDFNLISGIMEFVFLMTHVSRNFWKIMFETSWRSLNHYEKH